MKIRAVQFGVASEAEVLSMSVCEVVFSETKPRKVLKDVLIENSKAKREFSLSYEGTLYDERMGTLDAKSKCKTCTLDARYCPGHFGHINLKKPVINPHHIKVIGNILKCICIKCSRTLLTASNCETLGFLAHKGLARLRQIVKYCDGVDSCPYCSKPVPNFSFENEHFTLSYGEKATKKDKSAEEEKTKIPPESLFSILKKISDEDCCLLGLNNFLIEDDAYKNKELFPTDMGHRHATRPEWFIFTVLPVLPPVDRPPVFSKGKQKEDDITESYVSIIKANKKLADSMDHSGKAVVEKVRKTRKAQTSSDPKANADTERERLYVDLCEKIRMLLDNREGKKTINGKVPNGFAQLLKSKEGRIRGNIVGSRTNHTARSVITPDPYLPIGVLGVPRKMAKILKVKQRACRTNWQKCKEAVENGTCKTFIRGGGTLDVEYMRSKTGKCEIRPMDVLVCDLPELYPILFNRQPTLRIEGFMGLVVIFHDDESFKFNPVICTPYGGDFC
ncbi:hypothetical protein GMAR_ORF268 [Golden Marseillevirus]|uniref:hypothetical protein n=1 Tax=Golden Marseillevirus TaxID=1720526 RepID=UPI000877ABA9|nr:hypothetical protein GMAR_ORF268 [Golden Marseillevirus]ALX27642.1 hypothetical protein GMAR_ORF268 [Golden Marseillevirus]